MITSTRIEQSSLEQLRELAKSHRRSMTQELAVLIDAAYLRDKIYPAVVFPIPTPSQKTTNHRQGGLKSQAKFTLHKPLPKAKQ